MSRMCIAFAGLLLLALGAPAIGSRGDDVVGDVARGAKFYSDNCSRCHNARGPGEHRDREWSVVMTHMRVIAGLPGQQARDIEAFLRASNNPPRLALPSARRVALSGDELIEQYGCGGCHVIGGGGGTVGPSLDSVFDRRDPEWIRGQIKEPREQNPMTVMPHFGLSDAEVEAIMEALKRSR